MTEDEVLDHIYEHMDDEWGITLYDPLTGGPVEVYLTTPGGTCFQISVKEHSHG